MADKAVFLDRDHTIIEDPGYLNDPEAVKLLPGVELAIKSLKHVGYKVIVVTNQAGVARGLVTIESLEDIHREMRRQLSQRGAELDAIYYCPYHPEGTVEPYAKESELRKPQPGMLLAAAADMDIDLSASWMVGDSPCDVEAGQRAGCRTIRVRSGATQGQGNGQIEDAQADYSVRNLVDAASIILKEGQMPTPDALVGKPLPPRPPQPEPSPEKMSDQDVRREILRHVRQLVRAGQTDEFSFAKLLGAIAQVLALLALLIVIWEMIGEQIQGATLWALIGVLLQVMSLTFFTMQRRP